MKLKIVIILAVICGLSCCKTKEIERPNVVIVFTDDQGYNDVGCFGSDILTPNLDQMAKEGVKLTDFYAAQAVCSASRAALLTGCYPNRIGIHNAFMPNANKGLNHDETTMAEMLKNNGYTTAIFGKWHLGDHPDYMPLHHGFDEYFGIPFSNDMWPFHPGQGKYFNFGPLPLFKNESIIDTLTDQSNLTTQITEHAVDFIKRNKENPFFVYVAHPQPHVPLFVSDKFKGKSKRGLYGDVIMELDWSVGEIINTLKENSLEENTIVIFTSDNGPWLAYGAHGGCAYPLREGKGTALEGGQREPCIIKYPSKLKANTVVNVPLMSIDILPTIAYLTNSTLPELKIDGKNAWDIISGKSTENNHEAYYFYYRVNELHGVRYKHWKLYFPHTYRTLNGQEGKNDGTPIAYEHNTIKEIELYNLEHDISEQMNVAAEHPEIVKHICSLADKMRVELGDNLYDIEKGVGTRKVGIITEK